MSAPARIGVDADTGAAAFLEWLQPELEMIEEHINAEIASDVREICNLGGHVLRAGGKRLRPAMVVLSARAVNPEPNVQRMVTIAASMELVHMATLVHDDVVDNTAIRRGRPTANAVFGNGVAVLAGDFLLAKAMRLLALDGDLRVIRTVSDITTEMSEGEVMEILATGDAGITPGHYFEILRKKTAVFVDGCCRCGAIVGGATPEQEAALAEYGYHIGMAFQIADDLLDYTGDPRVTGKPVGSDLRDGRATLPLLIALSEASPTSRDTLLQVFGRDPLDPADVAKVVDIMQECDAFEHTRAIARRHVQQAELALATLPASLARDCFAALNQYVIQRDK